jgi:hypothetical protein
LYKQIPVLSQKTSFTLLSSYQRPKVKTQKHRNRFNTSSQSANPKLQPTPRDEHQTNTTMFLPSPTTTHHALLARGANDDGTTNANLSNGAIIAIVMISSGFLVLMGFSIMRFFFAKEDEGNNPFVVHDEQMQYMHSLRRRQLDHLKYSMGVKVSEYHPNDVASSDVSLARSSQATSQAFSP